MALKTELQYKPFEFDFEPAYKAAGWGDGISWRVDEFESEWDENTEWTGQTIPTGRVIAQMIGDDRPFAFDPEDLTPIADDDYCAECGQIGCTADGRDHTEEVS